MKCLKYILICCIALVISCQDAEYNIIENQVYLNSASLNVEGAETVVMNDGAEISVLVRLAKKVDYDVEIELVLAPELLEEFNSKNQTSYLLVPNNTLNNSTLVTIPAGEISVSHKIFISDFETKGNQYALPIKINRVMKGGIDLANKHSKFIYALAKPLKVAVPVMSGVNGQQVNALPNERWGIHTNEWTLECWSKMNGFSINNQAIFNLGSDNHEIYIRYGDANSPYNYLQIKTLGGQIQTASNLVANRWYHWAFVYDGVTLSIYRDGELDVRFQPPAPMGGNVRIDFLQMISSGATYFRNEAQLAQVKLWKKAISQNQIKNNMYFEINPKNPDLIGYWPMDEGSGTIFRDLTENGHDAEVGLGILRSWVTDVDFKN